MKITKTQTKAITYYECQPIDGICLFAFTKRRLLIDLCKVYGINLFNPLNLN